jgi:hypothetical protein
VGYGRRPGLELGQRRKRPRAEIDLVLLVDGLAQVDQLPGRLQDHGEEAKVDATVDRRPAGGHEGHGVQRRDQEVATGHPRQRAMAHDRHARRHRRPGLVVAVEQPAGQAEDPGLLGRRGLHGETGEVAGPAVGRDVVVEGHGGGAGRGRPEDRRLAAATSSRSWIAWSSSSPTPRGRAAASMARVRSAPSIRLVARCWSAPSKGLSTCRSTNDAASTARGAATAPSRGPSVTRATTTPVAAMMARGSAAWAMARRTRPATLARSA